MISVYKQFLTIQMYLCTYFNTYYISNRNLHVPPVVLVLSKRLLKAMQMKVEMGEQAQIQMIHGHMTLNLMQNKRLVNSIYQGSSWGRGAMSNITDLY